MQKLETGAREWTNDKIIHLTNQILFKSDTLLPSGAVYFIESQQGQWKYYLVKYCQNLSSKCVDMFQSDKRFSKSLLSLNGTFLRSSMIQSANSELLK